MRYEKCVVAIATERYKREISKRMSEIEIVGNCIQYNYYILLLFIHTKKTFAPNFNLKPKKKHDKKLCGIAQENVPSIIVITHEYASYFAYFVPRIELAVFLS